MSHTFFANDSQITFINLDNGNKVVFYSDDPRYAHAKALAIAGDFVAAELLDKKSVITSFARKATNRKGFGISVKDGVGVVTISGNEYPLNDVIVEKIVKMNAQGFSSQPLINFLANLYDNPSSSSIDELYLFLDKNELPITEDGCLVAYKIVREDYLDIYTGRMSNKIGEILYMPRTDVDDDRSNTCSRGLHFCSRGYLSSYGTSERDSDRCMIVKINPADVVSIPRDYSNAKGRTWKYEVIGEVTGNWRDTLPNQDYVDEAVVGDQGEELQTDVVVEHGIQVKCIDDYTYDQNIKRWRNKLGVIVSRAEVISATGTSFDDVLNLEV